MALAYQRRAEDVAIFVILVQTSAIHRRVFLASSENPRWRAALPALRQSQSMRSGRPSRPDVDIPVQEWRWIWSK